MKIWKKQPRDPLWSCLLNQHIIVSQMSSLPPASGWHWSIWGHLRVCKYKWFKGIFKLKNYIFYSKSFLRDFLKRRLYYLNSYIFQTSKHHSLTAKYQWKFTKWLPTNLTNFSCKQLQKVILTQLADNWKCTVYSLKSMMEFQVLIFHHHIMNFSNF